MSKEVKMSKEVIEEATVINDVLKISENHLLKIKEIQSKEEANKELAPEVCAKEYDLERLREFVKVKEEEYTKSKEALHKGYAEIGELNEKLSKEIKESYGDIQLTNLETGEYIKQ